MLRNGYLPCKQNCCIHRWERFTYEIYRDTSGYNVHSGTRLDRQEVVKRTYLDSLITEDVDQFYKRCAKWKLSAHNAVAFFTSVLTKKEDMLKTESGKLDLWNLLIFAIAADGFVFGTSVSIENEHYIRPSDYLPNILGHKHLYLASLDVYPMLQTAPHFIIDLQNVSRTVGERILPGRQKYDEWRSEWDTQKEKTDKTKANPSVFIPTDEEYFRLLDIYLEYIFLQGVDSKEKPLDKKALLASFKKYKDAGKAILMFMNFHRRILNAERGSLLSELTEFSSSINDKKNDEIIRAFNETDTKILFLQSKYFDAIKSYTNPKLDQRSRKAITNEYPSLNRDNPSAILSDKEKRIIAGYQEHELYIVIDSIITHLANPLLQLVGPYYLYMNLPTRGKPNKILGRRNLPLSDDMLKYEPKINRSNKSQVAYLKTHRYLYKALCSWWDDYCSTRESCASYDGALCDYLFDRTTSAVSDNDYFKTSEGKLVSLPSSDPLAILIRHVEGCFSLPETLFPQYANTKIMHHEMANLSDDSMVKIKSDRKIEKTISAMITDADIEQYKRLAFLNPNGLGSGIQDAYWHLDMARWMDSIIWREGSNGNKVRDYIAGDEINPMFPGTDWSLPALSKSSVHGIYNDIYLEDFSPNLARVELAIQRECWKKIRAEITEEAVRLCKLVFWGDEAF